jgi:hypothetical protein
VSLSIDERYVPCGAERVQAVWIGAVLFWREARNRSFHKLIGSKSVDSIDGYRSAIGRGAVLSGTI